MICGYVGDGGHGCDSRFGRVQARGESRKLPPNEPIPSTRPYPRAAQEMTPNLPAGYPILALMRLRAREKIDKLCLSCKEF